MKGVLVDENLPDAAHFPTVLPLVHARVFGPIAPWPRTCQRIVKEKPRRSAKLLRYLL